MIINQADKNKHNFRIFSADIVVILLLAIQLIMIASFYPEYEMPDENAQFNHIIENDRRSVYFMVMSKIYGFSRNFMKYELPHKLLYNNNFTYASNSFAWVHNIFNSPLIIFLKYAQLFLFLSFLWALYFFLKRNKTIDAEGKMFIFRLNLLYFLWPPVSFSLMSISSDFFIYLYETLFFVALVKYKKFLPLLIFNFLMLRFVDNGALMLLLTGFTYMCLYYLFLQNTEILGITKKSRIIFISLLVVAIYAILIKNGIIGSLFPSIKPHISYNYTFRYEPIKSAGTLFLTSYYLGGTVSLLAFSLEYIIFFLVIFYLAVNLFLKRGEVENNLFVFFVSGLLVFNLVLLTFPTLDQARYYYFFIPALIAFFDYFIFKSKLLSNSKYYTFAATVLFFSTIVKLFIAAAKAFVFN